jgi:predicted deacylase
MIKVSGVGLACFFASVGWTSTARATDQAWESIQVLTERIAPGEKKKFSFLTEGESTFEGSFVDAPVFVAHGHSPGPRLCVTAAIHGDEVNSVEIARRAFAAVDAHSLAGTLIVVPAVNTSGFRTANRYMPDRRDLNRYFPGSLNGSVASIVAYALFERVIKGCSYLIDLHTGSNVRTNYAQIRVDAADPGALELARHFGVGIVIGGAGPKGSLRREAMDAGIKAIIYEAGPPNIFQEEEIERGVEGIRNVMAFLSMTKERADAPHARVLADSHWIRVPRRQGGIFLPEVSLGAKVKDGQLLGTVTDPLTDQENEIRATSDGVVVGMALPQVVLSGYGLFHIGTLDGELGQ